MRYLNKIIFINSAHIPYAEIKVDGNVHFIGTQGVGKSTILRALLFFYNADQMKLGIPKEKKPFDTFYFEFPGSYIVYEVTRETSPYFIMAFRSRGRICYRFIDAPYRKDYFIDETGAVSTDWATIRGRIGKEHFCSTIIDTYEAYRDIIFGNTSKRGELKRFAITESSKYQNIPRTIQNVFLNSKLDADFIKDTIIYSLMDEDMGIDLLYYRNQVGKFRKEYRDISLWFKPDKRGRIKVRDDAERVVNDYRELLFLDEKIRQIASHIKFAVIRDRDLMPKLESQKQTYIDALERIVRLIGEVTEKFNREKDALNKELGVVNDKLAEIKRRRAYYREADIDDIVKMVEREGDYRLELESVRRMRDELMRENRDISDKYEKLCDAVRIELDKWLNGASRRIHEQEARFSDEKVRLSEDEKSRLLKLSDIYMAERETLADKGAAIRREKEECIREKQAVASMHPNAAKIEDYGRQLRDKIEEENTLSLRAKSIRREAETIVEAFKSREEMLQAGWKAQFEKQRSENQTLSDERDRIDHLISRASGSFYEWLENHKPDWRENIGRVVDDERVLYSTSLKPTIARGSVDSLFGVTINLDSLEADIRTPREMKSERNRLDKLIKEGVARMEQIRTEGVRLVEKERKAVSSRVADMRRSAQKDEFRLSQLPEEKKTVTFKIRELEEDEKEQREKLAEQCEKRLVDITHRLSLAEEEKERLDKKYRRNISDIERQTRDAVAKASKSRDEAVALVEADKQQHREKAAVELASLQKAQSGELRKKGVDTTLLEKHNRRVDELDSLLARIESSKEIFFNYKKDREELFDREEEFKMSRTETNSRLDNLSEKFEIRKKGYTVERRQLESQKDDCMKQISVIEDGLKKFEGFTRSSNMPSYYFDIKQEETFEALGELVAEINYKTGEKRDKTSKFRTDANNFNGNFSDENTFNFRRDLNTDADYLDFASGLAEFVEHDKIGDFRQRTSSRYGEILSRISKEVGDMDRHGGEIEKTIKDINHDFEAHNFAGVIKKIQLRATPSNDAMMKLLFRIHKFNMENSFDMGEINLFSNVESRENVTEKTIDLLSRFIDLAEMNMKRDKLTLGDTFKLEFRVVENDNDTGWVEKIANVGSDGTDVLVKAMVNIMLINVFKAKVSRKFSDFCLHCMMDEIGRLHPTNIRGILDFANVRGIFLINSSPTPYNVSDYRYTYLLMKDDNSKTDIVPLVARKDL